VKSTLQRMGTDPAEFETFVNGHLRYLTVLERITLLREMSYSRTIFFGALKKNGGEIDRLLFNQLLQRLPMSLRNAFEDTTRSYQDYRVVVSKNRLGRKKYGPMNQETVTTFLNELETKAFEVVKKNMEQMPDPSRFGYKDEEQDGDEADKKEEDVLAVLDEEESTDENEKEEEKVVIIT